MSKKITKEEAKLIASSIEKELIGKPKKLVKSIKLYIKNKIKNPGMVFAFYPKNDAEKDLYLKFVTMINMIRDVKNNPKDYTPTQKEKIIEKFSHIVKEINSLVEKTNN